MKNEYEILFKEYTLNKRIQLKNKIIMAPMTRAKASDFLPTDDMANYYGRRAKAGLIVTEGTVISKTAHGFDHVAGIFNHEQIKRWNHVTDAVHRDNGLIFLQIWHVGRVSHPHFLNGQLPISSSETIMTGRMARGNGLMFGQSRAATLSEINELIETYAQAATNAMNAGFDGIEIHGANGYLIDQFLHYHTNHRQDEYGGTPQNMTRFAIQVVHACISAIGHERVGLRLSPGAYLNEMVGDPRDEAVFQHLLSQLNPLNIAYVHVGNYDDATVFPALSNKTMSAFIRTHYQGNLIACGSYTLEKAADHIMNNNFDLIAMGRPFIANPDFIERIQLGKEFKAFETSTLDTLY